MTKIIIALLLAAFVCGACVAWIDGGAQAQASAFDRVCVCRSAYCWAQFVDAPGEWVLLLWGWEVRLPDTVALWNLETDWRCSR